MTNSDYNTASEQIRLAKEYFIKVDNGDSSLIDMFTVDAQLFFPKFGTLHGKQQIAKAAQLLMSAVSKFYHDPKLMIFTQSGNRLVVEGIESGYLADKSPFPGTGLSEGRYCNVFEFDGFLISRLHVYADPDLNGKNDLLFSAAESR
jgi:hypothetical protein